MKINNIGFNHTHSSQFSLRRPNGSGDYLFLHLKTPAIFILDGREIIAEKNSVILFNKGTPQIYRAKEGAYADDFVHFDMEGELDLKSIPYDTLLTLPSTKSISKLLKELYLEYISTNANRAETMELLLKLLFVKLHEAVAYPVQSSRIFGYYDSLLNLRSMIYRHPEEHWTISRMSKQLNLSPSHFQRLYRQAFGVSCNSDVISGKLQFAKTALAVTSDTVREIAIQCGYENEEHFMRQFKKVVGVTPTTYRKQFKS